METDKIISNTLDRVGMGKIKPSQTIIDKALSFNVNELDIIDDTDITKFIVALSQYLIYITLEINKLKIRKAVLDRDIEIDIATFIVSTGLSKGTKAERKFLAIGASPELEKKSEKLQTISTELMLLDNIDKYIEFYSNGLKKELLRREREHNFKAR
jgi:hypothetical protein